MRFSIRACGLALVAVCLHAQVAQAQDEVGMWDRFETSLSNVKTYTSPYTGVNLDVVYTRPDGSSFAFWGFYDGGSTWKARMMCDALGQWQYTASFSDGQPGKSGSFTCVSSNIPGMLTQDETNPRWLGFKGGEHVLIRSLHVGDRFFASNWSSDNRTSFVNWAQQQGYNMLSISSHLANRMEEGRGDGWDTPLLWPLNAAEFRKMESIMDLLADQRIMIYPFAGFYGKLQSNLPQTAADQEAYIRYVMARIGPYWNILMNVMGPEMNKHPAVDRLGALVQRYNVFDHPLGLHTFSNQFDSIRNKSWSSLMVVQGVKKVSNSNPVVSLDFTYNGLVKAYAPGKPVYAQETFWPGNRNMPNYTNDEIRKLGYITLMAGAALNYGDMDGSSSSGFSGTMDFSQKVQSRHDIMKKVWDFFETVPFYRMNPMPSLVNNGYCLAQPGREYLVYLPKSGKVDVKLTGGPYTATWVNAANTADRRAAGSTQDGRGLTSPVGGGDWLLRLVSGIGEPPGLPTIAFAEAGQSAIESSGTVTVTAELSRASDKPVSVSILIEGSAIAGEDYAALNDSISIAAGETTGSLSVELIDNDAVETVRNLTFSLGEPTNAIAGVPSTHSLSILDDDGPPSSDLPQVSFELARSSGNEATKRQRVNVLLSQPSDVAIVVPIRFSGSAIRNTDYRSYDQVTIPAGDLERSLAITLINDNKKESAETIVMTLGTPTNATLGGVSAHTRTIVDND